MNRFTAPAVLLLLLVLVLLPNGTRGSRPGSARMKRMYRKACAACLKCRYKQPLDKQALCNNNCQQCALGTTMPVAGGSNGGLLGGGAPNAYGIDFDTGVGTVSCYDIAASSLGKCGSQLTYAGSVPGIDFDAAIPFAYWPPGVGLYGNCADCGIQCSGSYGPSSIVQYNGQPLCYNITAQTTGEVRTIRVNDGCGGNCPSPPGDTVISGASVPSWPSCGPIKPDGSGSVSYDCAVWTTYYFQSPPLIQTNLAYQNVNQFRCPAAQECRTDWFGNTFPPRTDPPCPSGILAGENWSDFCSGKYMHFDLVSQVQGGPSCSDTGGLIYAFCGHSGHCAVDYQRIPCPP